MKLLGVDGCKSGWIVAEAAKGNISEVRFWIAPTAKELFATLDIDTIAVIDIPIGLPINKPRQCDMQARALLSPHGSRVFPAPSRAALEATDYRECCEYNLQAINVSLSKQTHAVLPKIREIDDLMSPERQAQVREAHPEVTFRELHGKPVPRKKTLLGQLRRLEILQQHGFQVTSATFDLDEAADCAMDDALDAAVCLVTAQRITRGQAITLGDGSRDARGRRMEMLA